MSRAPEPIELSVDAGIRYQTVRHFGASAAWWAQEVGGWDQAAVSEILDYLFDNESGIGLDVVRYNLGGGKERAIVTDPLRRVSSIESTPGVFDWTRDENAISVINGAVERGAEVVVFSNSPPARLTVTGAPTGNGNSSNLAAGAEPEFARFLVDATEYLVSEHSWPVMGISPINEPQWNWSPSNGQEGSHWSPEEAHRMVRALHEEIRERGADFHISAIESGEMKPASNHRYAELLLDDPELAPVLPHYAVHSYWSSPYDREALGDYFATHYPDVELWMTEWTEMQHGKDVGMDAALVLATTVHQDLTLANVSSWQYWIALSPYDYRDGLIYIDPVDETFEVAKKLWALGNWSRFLSQDAIRIQIDAPQKRGLSLSAYQNRDRSIVVVAVNMNRNRAYPVRLRTNDSYEYRYRAYETSASRDLEEVETLTPATFEVAPRSVLTVVLDPAGP